LRLVEFTQNQIRQRNKEYRFFSLRSIHFPGSPILHLAGFLVEHYEGADHSFPRQEHVRQLSFVEVGRQLEPNIITTKYTYERGTEGVKYRN